MRSLNDELFSSRALNLKTAKIWGGHEGSHSTTNLDTGEVSDDTCKVHKDRCGDGDGNDPTIT